MTRCPDCGRFRVTERQARRWNRWCHGNAEYWTPRVGFYPSLEGSRRPPLWWRLVHRRTQPWWFRWSLKCMAWHDCVGSYSGDAPVLTNWYERRCLRRVAS